MPDQEERRYLFVVIDRVTRWAYLEILDAKSGQSAQTFLKHLIEACLTDISIILTDSGKQSSGRFCRTGEHEPTGNHCFDRTSQANAIDHRLISPGHPRTIGMVERISQRIEKIRKTARFKTAKELEDTLNQNCQRSNRHLAFRVIGHRKPVQTMLDYYESNPECFVPYYHNLPAPNKRRCVARWPPNQDWMAG